MKPFEGKSWSISLLPDWIGEHEDECSLIYHPEGVGALQISAYTKATPVTDEDLREFAEEHIEAGAKLSPIQTGEFTGYTIALGIDDTFWQYWYLRNASTMLLVTYHCDEDKRNQELEQIKSMVATLAARRLK